MYKNGKKTMFQYIWDKSITEKGVSHNGWFTRFEDKKNYANSSIKLHNVTTIIDTCHPKVYKMYMNY